MADTAHLMCLGENLAMGYSSIQAVLNAWVDSEAQYYNSATKQCSGGVCGHFTQVLWRTTSYVGCGIARCASNTPIYVCQYLRPGNCNGYDYQTTNSPCGPFGP
jgi:pathogenesis-related protein 1